MSTRDISEVFNTPGPNLITYKHLIVRGNYMNLCLVKTFNSIMYFGQKGQNSGIMDSLYHYSNVATKSHITHVATARSAAILSKKD